MDEEDDDDQYPLTQNLARSSKDGHSELRTPPSSNSFPKPNTIGTNSNSLWSGGRKSRHKGHSSMDHISSLGNIQEHTPPDHYVGLEDESHLKRDEAEKKGLIKGIKQFVALKLTKKEKEEDGDSRKVGLLHRDIHLDDMGQIEDDSDDEFAAYDSHPVDKARVRYGGNDQDHYSAMLYSPGDEDDDADDIEL